VLSDSRGRSGVRANHLAVGGVIVVVDKCASSITGIQTLLECEAWDHSNEGEGRRVVVDGHVPAQQDEETTTFSRAMGKLKVMP
jgi:hypothetical protein